MAQNITKHIKSISIDEGVSSKTNNPYYYLTIVFDNGYDVRHFLNSDQRYIIASLVNNPLESPTSKKISVKDIDDEDFSALLED